MHSKVKISRLFSYLIYSYLALVIFVGLIIGFAFFRVNRQFWEFENGHIHAAGVFVSLSAAFLFMLFHVSRRINSGLEAFSTFLKSARKESIPISVDGLHLHELAELAETVNRMIVERCRTENALFESEIECVRLAAAIEQSAEAVIITDTEWRVCYINPAFEKMSRYSKLELIGRHAEAIRSESNSTAFLKSIREALTGGRVWSGRLTHCRKDGSIFEAEVTASPVRDQSGTIINYVSIHRDITEVLKLERDLRQAQKMEAIGTLAGGIAHDFNNILTAIIGNTEMALTKVPEDSALHRNLDQVFKAGARARDLVKQILTFSRKARQVRKPVQLVPLIGETLKLLRSSLPSTIEIRQRLDPLPADGFVMADPTQIHQVLMNLCTNAAYAMRDRGGVLSVSLSQARMDRSPAEGLLNLEPKPFLAISVGDTGAGMEPAILDRIFDPYFTTKKPGEGTGMGLALVQGIVRNHGGSITVDSKRGKGTTFSVYLPGLCEPVVVDEEIKEKPVQGGERILFVDDERDLVELGKEMLESLGYSVTVMTSSLQALDTFRAAPDNLDLVITDMTMPAMTGMELSRKILSIRPELPIILCTGFSDGLSETRQKETGIRKVVIKPYEISKLAKAIREILDH